MTRSLREAQIDAEKDDKKEQIASLDPWFHNLHLPDGRQTAPQHFLGDFPRYKWQRLASHLPARLDGWTALDIGCNAGYYSFELARRGAHVTGIDMDSHYLKQARWAAREFDLEDKVVFHEMQVYDLAHEESKFDLVLFMGVFYHLRYPLLGLDIVARRTGRMMIFQTMRMPGMEVYTDTFDHDIEEREALRNPGWPTMAFIEHRFANDPTNWWVPNHAGIEAMLRSSGMVVRAHLGHEIYLCEPAPPGTPRSYDFTPELRSATGRRWR